MQTKFKRHQKVKLLVDPNPDLIEYYSEGEKVSKGMLGEINIILPNGHYHIAILNEKGEKIAYTEMSEESLEEI